MAPKDQNFTNNGVDWNIRLEDTGELSFRADGKNGSGRARMVIERTSGVVEVGGSGAFGRLRLMSDSNTQTAFFGQSQSQCIASLGGTADLSGRINLKDSVGRTTVDLDGEQGVLTLGIEGKDGNLRIQDVGGKPALTADGQDRQLKLLDSAGHTRASVDGSAGRLQLSNIAGQVTADLIGESGGLILKAKNADDEDRVRVSLQSSPDALLELGDADGLIGARLTHAGVLTLGAALGGAAGVVIIKDSDGKSPIICNGPDGVITCVGLEEVALPADDTGRSTAPLVNGLDRVLALRGVSYRREQGAAMAAVDGDARQIGFVCEELEAVCPELVATDAEGRKSVNYSRMTAVLVEAIKEQHQQIREQAAALEAIQERLGQLSVANADMAQS